MAIKTATVAELRKNFRRISAWLENGESVEILKRGKRVARLVPAGTSTEKLPKIDFRAPLKATWGAKTFSEGEFAAMRDG